MLLTPRLTSMANTRKAASSRRQLKEAIIPAKRREIRERSMARAIMTFRLLAQPGNETNYVNADRRAVLNTNIDCCATRLPIPSGLDWQGRPSNSIARKLQCLLVLATAPNPIPSSPAGAKARGQRQTKIIIAILRR